VHFIDLLTYLLPALNKALQKSGYIKQFILQ